MSNRYPAILALLVCLSLLLAPAVFAQLEEEETAETEVTPPPEPAPAPAPEPAPAPAPEATPAPAPAPPAASRPAPPKKGGKVSLDFREIELTDLIQTISELTGRNFIYDETVRGKATIISPDPMTLDQAYSLFLTVLNVKGFTVVPAGRANKVIPIRDAKENNLPTFSDGARTTGDQFITRLVTLQNMDAAMVATTIAPLVPKTSSVVAYPPSNTLILTDTAANVERLFTIIRQLDVPSGLDLMEVIPLENADATEVAQLVNQILTQGPSGAPPRQTARSTQGASGPAVSRVIPYTRTNALVALATPQDMELIRGLVAKLDAKPTEAHAGIYVYYLENADAETLATTLNQIVTGVRAQPRAVRPGQPVQPVAAAAANQQAQSLGTVAITADKPTNSLIINSTPEDYTTLRGIIAQLDGKRKQVFVEALILELSMDATKRLGASLQGAFTVDGEGVVLGTSNLNQTQAGLGSLLPTDGGVPSLLNQSLNGILAGGLYKLIELKDDNGKVLMTVPAISALIDISKRTSDVNILSAPRLLTSDNEEAEIIVGQNVPIITQRLTDTGSTGLAQSVSIERRDVALTLRFTPQVTEGNLVRLNVLQEITDIAQSNPNVGDPNQVGPTLTKRLLRNTVLAENGRTIVLGGLISNNQQESISKVPLLGDIPGLGWLFKYRQTINRKTNLLVFITPRIIRSPNDLASVTRRSQADMEQFKADAFVPQINIDQPELLIIPPSVEPALQ